MVSRTGPWPPEERRVFRGDSSTDIKWCLFLSENVITKGIEPERKEEKILLYPESKQLTKQVRFRRRNQRSGRRLEVQTRALQTFSMSRDPEAVIRDVVEV
jgi:hypothetical protein